MENETTEISEEQRAREWRIIEEQQALEQRYMRVYTDYTLTILEPAFKCDLEMQHEWNMALQHVHDQGNCQRVLWSHDIKHPGRVLVLFEWCTNTPQHQKEDVTVWHLMEHLLESLPQPQHIALHPPDVFKFTSDRVGHHLDELLIITGDNDIFTPPDPLQLFGLESLAVSSIPGISHDPVVEFAGYAQGITPCTSDGQRVVAMLFKWVDEDKRSRFIDPTQHSYGHDTAYDQLVASRLRDLQVKGAKIDSYLCYLRSWIPLARATQSKRNCTIL